MPVLDFQAEDGEIISVLVNQSEPIESFHRQTMGDKVYKRIYSAPLTAKDTQSKDGTKSDFKRMTEGKNLTVGQMWEISKELSEKRTAKQGVDPVKEQFYKDYEKKTGGKHIDVKKREAMEKAKKVFESNGIRVD